MFSRCLEIHLSGLSWSFFTSTAKDIEPFLGKYQTNRPLIPFLAKDLNDLITDLIKRIIKDEVMESNNGALHLLNMNDRSILKDPSMVDTGLQATISRVTKKASDKQRNTFRMESRDFIPKMLMKILAKTPVKSALIRSLDWLNPTTMAATDRSVKIKTEEFLVQSLAILVAAKRVNPSACDCIKEYRKFCEDVVSRKQVDLFRKFSSGNEKHWVDELLVEPMAPKYPALWDVAQQLLLSHGQASVERGFSAHKLTTVEILSKEGPKARRIVIQAIHDAGGAENVNVAKEMLSYMSSARAKYQEYLDDKKKQEEV